MFELRLEFDGKDLEKAVFQAAAEAFTKTVRSMRCPTHGEGAKVIAKGRNTDTLNFQISGCCEELIEAVKAKLQ